MKKIKVTFRYKLSEDLINDVQYTMCSINGGKRLVIGFVEEPCLITKSMLAVGKSGIVTLTKKSSMDWRSGIDLGEFIIYNKHRGCSTFIVGVYKPHKHILLNAGLGAVQTHYKTWRGCGLEEGKYWLTFSPAGK